MRLSQRYADLTRVHVFVGWCEGVFEDAKIWCDETLDPSGVHLVDNVDWDTDFKPHHQWATFPHFESFFKDVYASFIFRDDGDAALFKLRWM